MEEMIQVNEVTLLDDSGNPVRFDHLLTFEYEGEKYIALLPLDDVEDVEYDEVVIFRIVTEDGEDVYRRIENEALLEEVFDAFLELFDEHLDEEEAEEDEEE